jgi:uncharacterized protein YndB with AHSA1/START domain
MTTGQRSAARAVADFEQGTILASVEIAAPPERVFRALTSQELVEWWGAEGVYQTKEWSADLRVGGRWRATGVTADGKPYVVDGEFIEVDPPRKLVQTWNPDWDGGHVTRLTYRLEPIPDGTRVTVKHEGFQSRAESIASHTEGWELVLGWLSRHCAEAATEDKWFLLRLLAPRPTFPMDMTAEERAMMLEHVAYWTQQMQAGTAYAFGPVLDPKGPWGLGLVRAADEDAIRRFEAGDPAIRSERGFRYEVLPLLRLVVRP